MHAEPSQTKVVTYDATKTSFVRVHFLLQFTYVKVHPLLHFSYDSVWLWCMDIHAKTQQCKSPNIYIHQQPCKSTPPFTLISSPTIALSSIYVHIINKSQFNEESSPYYHQHNHHHNYQQTSPQRNNFIQFLTIQVKEILHHTTINIVFKTYHPFIHLHIIITNYSQKICKVFGLKDHFRQSSSIVLKL
jgi:hypothetical protein